MKLMKEYGLKNCPYPERYSRVSLSRSNLQEHIYTRKQEEQMKIYKD